jgi:hypothetical protein
MQNDQFDWITDPESQEAVAACMNRCSETLEIVYRMESDVWLGISDSYRELYQADIDALYERYCYAMALVAYSFGRQFDTDEHNRKSYEMESNFAVTLNVCTDFAFKNMLGDASHTGGVLAYLLEDSCDNHYEEFWDCNRGFKIEILAVRKNFGTPERTLIHGFKQDEQDYEEDFEDEFYDELEIDPEDQYDDDEGVVDIDNLDFLHMMRLAQASGNVNNINVDKFLSDTKRVRLPFIIKQFLKQPSYEVFTPVQTGGTPLQPKARRTWWKFWK